MAKLKKIGVDYHGVINTNADFFKIFNRLALKEGLDVVVISGGHQKDVEKYLKDHKILYTDIWSVLDYFDQKNMVTYYEDESFFVPNEIWNKAKAKYCLENNIDIHIDDSMLYGTYFQTPFCLYSKTLESCSFIKKNIPIKFTQSPQKVLKDLQKAFEKINSE